MQRSTLLKELVGSLLGLIALLAIGIPMMQSRTPALPGGAFVYPIVSARLSSKFGKRVHPIYKAVKHHNGVDLAAPQAAPIRAIATGTVVFSDPHKGYGNLVVISHGNGLTSHYGHCHTIKASVGERIEAGEIIATVGKTGNVTGPHLHLEIRQDGKPKDPKSFLPYLSSKAKG